MSIEDRLREYSTATGVLSPMLAHDLQLAADELYRLRAIPEVPTVTEMVNRFLSWKLPQDFAPDCHITFKLPDPVLNPNPSWPVGTNLFTADQARAMFEHVLSAPKMAKDSEEKKA